ncbi:hypothetical protein DFH09DRAFT_1283342 [Mycena vulgaris]|nr:hypothetical protein DFH09DRAFT_1283342 [Mycena vulgaris]
MSTAKIVVISTPELLELVLSNLPMRDLLVTAPLVSKTWQTITLSPTLQRALFFQPDPSAEPVQNPLLVEMFPPFFTLEGDSHWSWPGEASSIMSMPWFKAPDAFKWKEASWRRMLVMQPPAQKMTVTEIRHVRGCPFDAQGYAFTRGAVLNSQSLRMDTLYDFIDLVASSFRIRWHDNSDAEGDLDLAVILTEVGRESLLDKWFSNDGAKSTKIDFGGWVQCQVPLYASDIKRVI